MQNFIVFLEFQKVKKDMSPSQGSNFINKIRMEII